MNFYHSYGNQGASRSYGFDRQKDISCKSALARTPSEKQYVYYTELRAFAEDHGVRMDIFPRVPRSAKSCSERIRALFTVLNKMGIDREFMETRGEKNELP